MAADISNFESLSWKDFFAGWISGICSITVGYPLETIKVRQQMTVNSRSASHHAINMLKNEGIRCFYRGLSYPVMTTGVTNSLYFGFFANSLRMMENSRDEKHYRNCCDYGSIYPGWHRDCFLAGCIGGAASTLINIPVELAKTVSQAHARDTATGQKFANESTVLRNIFRSQGVRGCFRGANILILRDVPIFGLYAICYEHINCLLKPKHCVDWFTRTLCEGLAGGFAGVITWFIAMPCDVVKSRYTSDCYRKTPQYSSTLDCVRKTYQQHGWKAFFKGTGIACLRAFPVNLICFVMYEQTLRCF